ncbi:hypothetical protein [uncultured Tyzzerella sp.]|uniref:hypothetical protein n=1 Tax=uncultured Tyzzerella sp. TaxID=2321398 RepID=UPI0029422371|nr:hypothetical protein [uncultured Tyzzerella sp.]
MNNPIGTTCGCGVNNENLLFILVLLIVLCPGFIGGFGNDSFILILFLLILMPNSFRNIC